MNSYQQTQLRKKREKWGKLSQPCAYLYADHPGMVWYGKRRQLGLGFYMPSNFVVPRFELPGEPLPWVLRSVVGPEY